MYSSDNTHHHILDASEAQGTISLQEVQSGTNEVILLVDVEEQRSHYYVQYNKPRSRARTSDDGNVPESTEPKRICAEPDLTSMGSQMMCFVLGFCYPMPPPEERSIKWRLGAHGKILRAEKTFFLVIGRTVFRH